jgi:hypothetical protein
VTHSGEFAPLPEGMTAEKLRTIAGWLDTYDRLAARYVDLIEVLVEKGLTTVNADYEAALRVAAGKEVQDDLRRWADAIDERYLEALPPLPESPRMMQGRFPKRVGVDTVDLAEAVDADPSLSGRQGSSDG